MQSFNVLDRQQDIQRSYLLEASAGTGKTFSIENIVVRLLIEGDNPPSLEQILVVTFTRAAMRDLKIRIRLNIEKALIYFSDPSQIDSAPDYLRPYCEQGGEILQQAKRRLEQALFCFDQSGIFTIHGFCSRMLRENLFEADIGAHAARDEETNMDERMIQTIRDFFRTELKVDYYSPGQLMLVLEEHGHSIEKLEKALLKIMKTGLEVEGLPGFSEQFVRFKQCMNELKKKHTLIPNKIVADFLLQAPAYEKLCDRSRNVKPEILQKIERFAALFDKEEWNVADFDQLLANGLFFVDALDPARLKASSKPISLDALNYSTLLSSLRTKLYPLIQEAANPILIVARMAKGCREMLHTYISEEEKFGFDDLLHKMHKGVQNPLFAEKVRKKYRAAIVDEFQDTDHLQWEIFRILFMQQNRDWGKLYLVGDPKQSIYAFRQADIYTYLSAAEVMGSHNHASLDTNYRSQPSLVYALNALFSQESAPGLIALPSISKALEYRPVKASTSTLEKKFSDTWGSVHFCFAESPVESTGKQLPIDLLEEEAFFPFFAKEIERLHQLDGIKYNQCAILVSDRFQASRLAAFLKTQSIPTLLQKASKISESPAVPALCELLQAVIHPKRGGAVKIALGGKIIGWDHFKVRALEDAEQLEGVLERFYALRRLLFTKGFAAFFEGLMASRWNDTPETITERLLALEFGVDFYDDLWQIATLLMEEEEYNRASPETMLAFLDRLQTQENQDEERLKRFSDNSLDGVNILTLHSSKGLEFDIVFAVGLITRSRTPEELIPIKKEGGTRYLQAITDKDSVLYQQHCHEIDAEKIRQLYVAMTRAKYRLYLPVALGPHCKPPLLGSASPMDLFLARLGYPETGLDRLYERIAGYEGSAVRRFLSGLSSEIRMTHNALTRQKVSEKRAAMLSEVSTLCVPEAVHIPGKRQSMFSFTTLTANQSKPSIVSDSPPHDYLAEEKTAHTLPSGSDTGNLLHQILERICRESISGLEKIVYEETRNSLFSGWESVIIQMIEKAFQTPLSVGNQIFRLRDISTDSCYCETEFLYRSNGIKNLEGFTETEGFLKGVIDLLFYHEGKYYLLDWKSNWLGPTEESYRDESLKQAMEQSHYFLQAEIYRDALQRYLRLVDARPFDEIFGGVFYVFLRGVSSTTGIYHFFEGKKT